LFLAIESIAFNTDFWNPGKHFTWTVKANLFSLRAQV
jgi:hypothetical protein